MPDKTELMLKAMETRLTGLERSIDALKKANMPDAKFDNLPKQVLELERRVGVLEQTIVTKKDVKSREELESKQMQQVLAKQKAEHDQITNAVKKEQKQMLAQIAMVEKVMGSNALDHKLNIFDTRLKILEARTK